MMVAPTSCHRPCPQHHVPESVLSLGDHATCPVPLQVRNGTLSIAVVERASAGTYTCHASSKEGTITHTTRVLVQGKSRGSPSPGRMGTAVGHGGSHVTGVGFWGRHKCDGFWEQLGPFPVFTIPSVPCFRATCHCGATPERHRQCLSRCLSGVPGRGVPGKPHLHLVPGQQQCLPPQVQQGWGWHRGGCGLLLAVLLWPCEAWI